MTINEQWPYEITIRTNKGSQARRYATPAERNAYYRLSRKQIIESRREGYDVPETTFTITDHNSGTNSEITV